MSGQSGDKRELCEYANDLQLNGNRNTLQHDHMDHHQENADNKLVEELTDTPYLINKLGLIDVTNVIILISEMN